MCSFSYSQVVQYIGELCRYLLSQPHRPSENKHSVRLAIGNGLRPQIWKEFQTRFGIEEIGEFYGSTEGTASVINIDSTPGACGFVSEILPSVYPVVIFKVDPETGELVRGPDGLAVRTKPGEVGQIVGKSSRGNYLVRGGYQVIEGNMRKSLISTICKSEVAADTHDQWKPRGKAYCHTWYCLEKFMFGHFRGCEGLVCWFLWIVIK